MHIVIRTVYYDIQCQTARPEVSAESHVPEEGPRVRQRLRHRCVRGVRALEKHDSDGRVHGEDEGYQCVTSVTGVP